MRGDRQRRPGLYALLISAAENSQLRGIDHPNRSTISPNLPLGSKIFASLTQMSDAFGLKLLEHCDAQEIVKWAS